MPIIK